MSFEDFKTCVDKLPPDAQIHFSGFGEPQVNPAFADMVLYAHSTGRPVVLYSTFVGMTRESYERIRDVPFKSVTPHIPDRDSNSHFTLSPEYLELLNLVLADAAAGRFKVHGYSCHGTVHPAIAEIFTKNGLPTPRGRSFSELQDRSGNVKNPDVIHLSRKKGRLWCHPTGLDFNHNVILPDGTVCLCCQDFGMDHVLGNLLTQSYEQIMQGEVLENLRHLMRSEKYGDCLCRRCPIAESDFEYFVKSPFNKITAPIRRKVALRTRIRKLIKRSARHS